MRIAQTATRSIAGGDWKWLCLELAYIIQMPVSASAILSTPVAFNASAPSAQDEVFGISKRNYSGKY